MTTINKSLHLLLDPFLLVICLHKLQIHQGKKEFDPMGPVVTDYLGLNPATVPETNLTVGDAMLSVGSRRVSYLSWP